MNAHTHKRVSDFINSKLGVCIFLLNGILLSALMAYSLSQYKQKTSLQIVCGIITLVFSLVTVVTNTIKGYRMLKSGAPYFQK